MTEHLGRTMVAEGTRADRLVERRASGIDRTAVARLPGAVVGKRRSAAARRRTLPGVIHGIERPDADGRAELDVARHVRSRRGQHRRVIPINGCGGTIYSQTSKSRITG